MIWIVGGCIVLGSALCCLAGIVANSDDQDISGAAPLYMLPGVVLIAAGVALALGNAAFKALL